MVKFGMIPALVFRRTTTEGSFSAVVPWTLTPSEPISCVFGSGSAFSMSFSFGKGLAREIEGYLFVGFVGREFAENSFSGGELYWQGKIGPEEAASDGRLTDHILQDGYSFPWSLNGITATSWGCLLVESCPVPLVGQLVSVGNKTVNSHIGPSPMTLTISLLGS